MNKELLAAMAALLISGNLSYLAADASQPELTQNTGDPNQSTLSWDSEPNYVYFIQHSDDLSNWSWAAYHFAEAAALVEMSFPTTESQSVCRLQYTEFSSDNPSPLLTGDFDGDLISNYDEINTFSVLGLDALNADSDGNGINDGAEDSDGDQLLDHIEFLNNFNPNSAIDSDGDLIADDWEAFFGYNPNDNTDATFNTDGDTLDNLQEFDAGTNPNQNNDDNVFIASPADFNLSIEAGGLQTQDVILTNQDLVASTYTIVEIKPPVLQMVDNYSYMVLDAQAFNNGWIDISGIGEQLSISQNDDAFEPVDIGFYLPFYNGYYKRIQVGTNGILGFLSGTEDYQNQTLGSNNYNFPLLAPLWDDLSPQRGGEIYVLREANKCTIQYDNVMRYSGSGEFTFQVVLHRSGEIYFYYEKITASINSIDVGYQQNGSTGASINETPAVQSGFKISGTLQDNPDDFSFGDDYVVKTSTSHPGEVPFIWNDISGTGDSFDDLAQRDDAVLTLSGLNDFIPFYDDFYNGISIYTEGLLSFGGRLTSWFGNSSPFPMESIDLSMLAPLWMNLDPSSNPNAGIYFQESNDAIIIQYDQIPASSISAEYTFQVQMHKDGRIHFYYNTISGSTTGAVIGMQNNNGGLNFINIADEPTAGFAILFNREIPGITPESMLSVSQSSGNVSAFNSKVLTINIATPPNSRIGIYRATIRIDDTSDDSTQLLEIPLQIEITTTDDFDGDGLTDQSERFVHGTNPFEPDSDFDGLTDYEEIMTYGTDPNNSDHDGDFLADSYEVNTPGQDPFVRYADPPSPNYDTDSLPNMDENLIYGTDPFLANTDGDTLDDDEEVLNYGTDPLLPDTDGDGQEDGAEVSNNSDPFSKDHPLGEMTIFNLQFQ